MNAPNETRLTILEKNKPTLAQLALVNMAPGTSLEDAQRVVLKEISNFEMLVQTKPDLLACKPISILLAIKQTISDNLTLATSAALVYLVPGKVKVGQNGNQDIYEWVLNYDPTANGRLSIARQSGRILDNKRPVIKYGGDERVESVTVEFLVPSFPEPRWEVITFNKVHFNKWKNASAAKNKGSANANYTSYLGSIDPEFAGTKAIRHGLGKLGTNMNEIRRGPVPNAAPIKYEPVSAVFKEADEHAEEITPHVEVTDQNQSQSTVQINPDLL